MFPAKAVLRRRQKTDLSVTSLVNKAGLARLFFCVLDGIALCGLNAADFGMDIMMSAPITFTRLTEVPLTDIAAHMSDPKVAEHMPLLTGAWDEAQAATFVAAKEACWQRDGLGHWAFWSGGDYLGWGGFQKEGEEWDFGLVLRPDRFGWGLRIAHQALTFARRDSRIPYVTFLLPPTRRHLRGLARLGAVSVGEVTYDGARFLKFRLDTATV